MPNAIVQGSNALASPLWGPSQQRCGLLTALVGIVDSGERAERLPSLDAFSRTLREAQNRYAQQDVPATQSGAHARPHRARQRRRVPQRIAAVASTPPPDDVRIVRIQPPIVFTLPKTRAAFFRAIASGTQPFENGVKMTALLMDALNMPMSDARRKRWIAVGRAIDDASGAIPEVLKYRLILEVAGVTADYLENRQPDEGRLNRLIDSARIWQAAGAIREAGLSRAPKEGAMSDLANSAVNYRAKPASSHSPGDPPERRLALSSGDAHPADLHSASHSDSLGAGALSETLDAVAMSARGNPDASSVRRSEMRDEARALSHEQLLRAENERRETAADRTSSDLSSSGGSSLERSMAGLARLARPRHRTSVSPEAPGTLAFVDDVPLHRESGAQGTWGWREVPLESYEVNVPLKRADGRLVRHQFKRYLHLDGRIYPVKKIGKGQYVIVHPDNAAWPSIPIEKWYGTWRRRAPHSLSPDVPFVLGSDGIYRSDTFKALFYGGMLRPVLRESIVGEARIAPLATSLDARVSGVGEHGVLGVGERHFIEGKHGYYPVTFIGDQVFAVNAAGRPLFWMKFRDGRFRVAEQLSDESASRLSVMRDGDGTVRTPSSSSLQSNYRALDENVFLTARPILLKAMKSAMRSFIQMRPLYQRADAVHLGSADVELSVMRERIDAWLRHQRGRGDKSVIAWQFQMSRATRKIYRQNPQIGHGQQIKCHEAADILYYGLWKRGLSDHILLIQFVQLPGSGLAHVQLLYADDAGWLRRAFGDLDKRGGEAVDDLREYTRESFEHLLANAAHDAGTTGSQVALIDGWGAEKLVVVGQGMSRAEIAEGLSANLRAARFDLGARDSYQVKVVR